MITLRKWLCMSLVALWLLGGFVTGALAADTAPDSMVPASIGGGLSAPETDGEAPVDAAAPMDGPLTHLVVFYDIDGEVLGEVTVEDGALLFELDGYPPVEGYVFQYWYAYDEDAEEDVEIEPFVFGQPVTGALHLVPFYLRAPEATVDGETPDALPGTVPDIAPDAFDTIVADILVTEPALDGETPATAGPADEAADEAMAPESLVRGMDAVLGDTEAPEALFRNEPLPPDRIVLVTCSFDGDTIDQGAEITLTAELVNFPADRAVAYRWQNNATGTFLDVSGATDQSYTFVSDGVNTRCSWQVVTTLAETPEGN